MFIALLTSLFNGSNHAKCKSLSNQKCMTQPTLINLHPNEYSQELHYYPFAVKLYRCVGSCSTLNELSNKVCVPNKTEDLSIHVFNMITGTKMNQKFYQKTYHANVNINLMEENVIQAKSDIMIDVDANVKKIYVKQIIFGILLQVLLTFQ